MKNLCLALALLCLQQNLFAINVPVGDTLIDVIVFKVRDEVPANAKVIEEFKFGDNGFKTDCQYERVLEKVKEKAVKAGGNAIKITELKQPDIWSSCYRMKGNILSIPDPEKYLSTANDFANSNPDGIIDSATNYSVLYIYRPRNFSGSAIGYDVYLDDSLLCRATNNSKYEIKVTQTGKHKIWAKTEAKAIVPVNLVPGRKYYIKCAIQTGMWVGQPSMNLVDPSQGQEEYDVVQGRKK